jgi:hypothetical protein
MGHSFLYARQNTGLLWHTAVRPSVHASYDMGFLRRNIYRCPQDIKEQAYKSLVRPHLEYASAVWDPYRQVPISYSFGYEAVLISICWSTQSGKAVLVILSCTSWWFSDILGWSQQLLHWWLCEIILVLLLSDVIQTPTTDCFREAVWRHLRP